ncbi:uncharacterized protein [Littorina saxatilis]|uniref:uncharacterized protein n=1 Tax=Littorina saxatilis TaxID=31220 RepID=UPI0038B6B128
MDVPHFVDGYPPPKPPSTKPEEVFHANDFADIDKNARKAPDTLRNSYDDLLAHLLKGVTSDLGKVRSIFVWLSAQPVLTMTFPKVTRGDTPHAWLKRIKFDRTIYTDFFALLCRKAEIPCVTIEGSSKGAGYEVGQTGLKVTNRWNAVHVQGSWRLVNVPWALITTDGLAEGDWELVEKSGQAVREKEVSRKEVRQDLDEFWFLTDPEDFNAFCHASDRHWQLLQQPWTDQEFLGTPRYAEDYFTSGWEILTCESGVLDANEGRCQIAFSHPEGATSASLTYNLYFNPALSKKPLPEELQLVRYVLENSKEGQKMLATRLPQDGVYRIEIAGVMDGTVTGLGEFRINCRNVGKTPQPFPDGCSQIGYNEHARNEGLVEPSHQDGIVEAQQGERVDLRFKFQPAKKTIENVQATLTHKAQQGERVDSRFKSQPDKKSNEKIQAILTHNSRKSEDLSKLVEVKTNKDDVCVSVQVPRDDAIAEYGLIIMAVLDESSRDSDDQPAEINYNTLVNYLITSDTKLVSADTKNIVQNKNDLLAAMKNVDVAKFQQSVKALGKLDPLTQSKVNEFQKTVSKFKVAQMQVLVQAMHGSDINQLEQALADYQKLDGVNLDVITQAKACLELLKLLKDDVDVVLLEKALRHAYDVKLQNNVNTHTAEEVLVEHYEKGLYEAFHRRSLEAVKTALAHAVKSCVAARIKGEFIFLRAQEMSIHLEAMKKLTDKIGKLTSNDLMKIAGSKGKEGHPHVKSVVMATFILLGEREQELWDWPVLQNLLERRGDLGVSRAMASLDVDKLTDKQVDLAESHVRQCQLDVLKAESSSAALFLQWVQAIVEEKRGRDEVNQHHAKAKK